VSYDLLRGARVHSCRLILLPVRSGSHVAQGITRFQGSLKDALSTEGNFLQAIGSAIQQKAPLVM
jgi:hypothetical protein